MFSEINWLVLIILQVMVALQALASYADGFLTPQQMVRKGIHQGVPFLGHTGMWSDVLFISPLMAAMTGVYISSWSWWCWVIGTAVSAFHHWMYTKGKFPEAHVQKGKLTVAGWIHFMYMAACFSIILQFYLEGERKIIDVITATSLLWIHVILAMHVPMKMLKPWWFPYWGIWNKDTLGPIKVSTAALVALSVYALV